MTVPKLGQEDTHLKNWENPLEHNHIEESDTLYFDAIKSMWANSCISRNFEQEVLQEHSVHARGQWLWHAQWKLRN